MRLKSYKEDEKLLFSVFFNNDIQTKNAIYPFTNEQINEYLHYFATSGNMLTLLSPGDQIFNAILM